MRLKRLRDRKRLTLRLSDYRRMYHSADHLFALVSDVRRYPDFIGPITGMRILKEAVDGSRSDLTAEARVRYKFVSESFTTRVLADGEAHSIDVSFVSGPFRILENKWRFHALSDGSSLVEFHIAAAFKNPVLQMMLMKNRERASHSMINRFSSEADNRYERIGDEGLDLAEEINALKEKL